jgi:hypothetical protein
MSWVGVAIAGASVIGSVVSSGNASSAANAQTNAANQANSTQQGMFNTTNANQAPWRQAGGQAVNALSQFYGLGGVTTPGDASGAGATTTGQAGAPNYNQILSNLPGYQFQQQQGNLAIQRDLAAQGLLQSGAAGKELQTFGQGLASNYAQQYAGGLQSLAGLGQSSVQATGVAGTAAANQIGGNQIYAGNAQATGYANQSQAMNSGLSGIVSGLGYMNQQQQYSNPYMDQSAMDTYQNGSGLMNAGGGYMYNTPGLN